MRLDLPEPPKEKRWFSGKTQPNVTQVLVYRFSPKNVCDICLVMPFRGVYRFAWNPVVDAMNHQQPSQIRPLPNFLNLEDGFYLPNKEVSHCRWCCRRGLSRPFAAFRLRNVQAEVSRTHLGSNEADSNVRHRPLLWRVPLLQAANVKWIFPRF